MRGRRTGVLLTTSLVLWLVLLSGCGSTARVNQFRSFAQAGVAFSDATGKVLQEAGDVAIDADSKVLEKTRASLPPFSDEESDPPTDRAGTVVLHNELLRERLRLLGDLTRHARLLRSYFGALAALAESDAPSAVGTAAEGVVTSLGKLNPSIAQAKIGDFSVKSFIGKVAQFTVAAFQSKALENELKARAATIERELDLQQAALTAVTEQMRVDLQALLNLQETSTIVDPYIDAEKELPAKWAQQRREILRANLPLSTVSAAADAAGALKISFVSLVEGRFTMDDLPSLIQDINRILDHVEATRVVDAKK